MTLIDQIAGMKAENIDLYNAMIEKGKLEAKSEIDAGLSDVEETAHAKGVEAGRVEGREEGITAERERISALTELSNTGNKEMINKFIADGKTTAPEAAVEILKAQNAAKATGLEALESNSPTAIDTDAGDSESTDQDKKGMKQLVSEYQVKENCSKGDAIKACAKLYPNAENDFVQVVKKHKY